MNTQNNIEDNILTQIKEGKIKMKPRAYFIAKTTLFGLAGTLLLLFLIYLASFIVFNLRLSGALFLPAFGFVGVKLLLASLPWFLILLAFALIILLEAFAESMYFIYKRPAIYSLLGIILIVLVAGLLIGFSSLHTRLFSNAREGSLPVIGPFYNDYGAPKFHNLHNGSIIEIINDGFVIETPNGETLTVVVNQMLKQNLEVGDFVLVVGERMGNTIQARILKKINEDTHFFPSQKMRGPGMYNMIYIKSRVF